jgi:hypothetical protein
VNANSKRLIQAQSEYKFKLNKFKQTADHITADELTVSHTEAERAASAMGLGGEARRGWCGVIAMLIAALVVAAGMLS